MVGNSVTGINQAGRALALGARGRRFKSYMPDSPQRKMEIIEITEQEAQDRLEELVDSTESGTVYCIVRPDGSKVMMVPADPSKIQLDDDDIDLYTNHEEALLRLRLFLSDILTATSSEVLLNSMVCLTIAFQKFDEWNNRYKDMYLLDNSIQLDYAMEDFEYTKWLDPDRVPCYVRDVVS